MSDSAVTRTLLEQRDALNEQANAAATSADRLEGHRGQTAYTEQLRARGEDYVGQVESLEPVIALSRRLDAVVALVDEVVQRIRWADADDLAAVEALLAVVRDESEAGAAS